MSFDAHVNFGFATISVAPSPALSGTTFTLAAGGVVPAVPFYMVVAPTATAPLATNAEVIRVTAMSGLAVTASTRAQGGSSARTILVGDQCLMGGTKEDILAVEAAITAEISRATTAESSLQPLDSDLTAIAALSTTTFGRSLLTAADAAGLRTLAALGTAATQNTSAFDASGAAVAAQAASQPLDSDLTAIAALTTTSFGRSLLILANAAALLAAAGAAAATDLTTEATARATADALLTPLTDLRLFTPSLPRPLDQPQTILTQFQSGHGFAKAAGTGSQTDDTSDFVDGTQSLEIVTLGDASAYITQKSSISPMIDATGKQLRIVFWVTSIANVADLSIYLSSDNGATNNYHQSILTIINAVTQPYCQDGERVEYVINWCDLDSTGSPNRAAINFLKLRVADKNGVGVTAHFQSIALEPEP